MLKNYVKLILSLVFVSNVIAQNVPSYVPTNGLVGWWPFNGNANDESGNGNNGTVNGATLTEDRNGKANSAYDFDGLSNYISNNVNITTDTFSLSIWYYAPNPTNPVLTLFNLWDQNNVQNQVHLGLTTNPSPKKFLYTYHPGIGQLDDAFGTRNLSDWHHVVMIIKGNTQLMYVDNNTNYGTKIGSSVKINFNKFELGRELTTGLKLSETCFQGKIDDVSFYNRALTQQEITALYTGTPVAQNIPSYVPKNGLVGWWPFNGNTNDESGNNLKTSNYTSVTFSKNRYSEENSSITISSDNNSYLEILPDAKLNSTIFTWSFWISTKNSGEQGVFSRTPIGNTCNGVTIMCLKENIAAQNLQCINSVGNYGHGSNINVADLAWHHVIFTIEPGKPAYFIIDGIKQEKGDALPLNFTVPYDQPIRIGRTTDFYWSKFIGQIDDIAIYNRVLTEQEISALYNGSNQSALASTKVFVDAPATVNQNQEVELSISTEALNTADNVIAYQTDLSYDATRYTYVGSNLTGTLNPNGSVDINTSNNGLLKIGYMSQTALNGAGSLVKLKFKANNTLGQGIFGLSNFLYNTVAVSSLKNDTVNTIDVIPPTARINYSHNPVRKGDSLLITVKFNEKMAVSPVPQLNLSGQNTLPNTNLTKVDDTTYTFWWVVEKGNGAVNVTLATGQDLGGNVIVATPTQNPSFNVLPTVFGDIDTNTLVQAYDAALALQYSVGLNPLPTMDPLPWSNWRIAVANVDTVGNVTANDASLILQKSIGKIATFPADAKKRGGDAPVANVTVTQEGNQLVFRTTGTLYAFNVFMKDNFNVLGQPDVKNKGAMLATNINATTYNVGLASTTPFVENEPFLVIPILTNENVQGTMDIVANSQERSLSYGKAAGINAINKEAVIVYPNPTKDNVTINNAQGKTLRIVDVQGKEVYNQKVTTSTMELSMKTLGSKGMYVLHIFDANNESVQTKQIVLE